MKIVNIEFSPIGGTSRVSLEADTLAIVPIPSFVRFIPNLAVKRIAHKRHDRQSAR